MEELIYWHDAYYTLIKGGTMLKWILSLIVFSCLECSGWEYNGDDPQVDAGYIWYNGTEWIDLIEE